jgi:hypothetical protein
MEIGATLVKGLEISILYKWISVLIPRYINCKEYYKHDPADMITILKHIV